ncbi:hypothetical protein PT974_07730 [Cladobotryum mycophilum]|uniref:Transmembrane protein n=1 Tax=Cladobotryum mycophilum TaxID=491253 RepID=A0ABR0SIN3_9HYPO
MEDQNMHLPLMPNEPMFHRRAPVLILGFLTNGSFHGNGTIFIADIYPYSLFTLTIMLLEDDLCIKGSKR